MPPSWASQLHARERVISHFWAGSLLARERPAIDSYPFEELERVVKARFGRRPARVRALKRRQRARRIGARAAARLARLARRRIYTTGEG